MITLDTPTSFPGDESRSFYSRVIELLSMLVVFKTGGRLIRPARSFILQLAESHLTRRLVRQILRHIERLGGHPT